MRIARASVPAVISLLLAFSTAADVDSVVVIERETSYEITVPVSELVMTVPREGLSHVVGPGKNPTASRRYFRLQDEAQVLSVSGWFEPEQNFPGMVPYWKLIISDWAARGVSEPTDVVFKKIGRWDAVTYRMPLAAGTQSNLQAHWLEAGTWIHLHLSLASKRTDVADQQALESLLGRIHVMKK